MSTKTPATDLRRTVRLLGEAAEKDCHFALAPDGVQALAKLLDEHRWNAEHDPHDPTASDQAAVNLARLINTREDEQAAELEAFRAFTVDRTPTTVEIDGREYRSDRTYTDAAGDCWSYLGTCDGSALWHRDGELAGWNLAHVIKQFGPLTHPAA